MISVGEKLPKATLVRMGAAGPEPVSIADKTKGRKVAIFAVPGAYTPTCSAAHVPSFIRTRDQFIAKGVDEIICISVNDPFVMAAWGKDTGATDAGISMLADADCSLTEALGMRFDSAATGLLARSLRYAMLVEDGEVKILQMEKGRGVCELTAGESLLEAVG